MFLKTNPIALATLIALGFSTDSSGEDERYIIHLNSSQKQPVIHQARISGGILEIESNRFIAATFKGKDLQQVKGLMNNPAISKIEPDLRRYPLAIYNDDAGNPNNQQLTPYSIYQSQADQLDIQPGIKVCVIDSGIAGSQGETGGRNSDFNWGAITGDNDSGTGNWDSDGGPHGTHVAGTVGAMDNNFGVIGMAPGVSMHIIKVFNASGWGYSSDLAFAATKCAAAGANIITMSLGGGGANSAEENAFIDFSNNGGLVLAAAGNDGNDTRSYPAGYKSVMMIGANDADNNIASFSQYPDNKVTIGRGRNRTQEVDDGYGVEVTAGGVAVLSTYPAGAATLSSLNVNGTAIPSSAMENSGHANGDTYYMALAESQDIGANGKICVIERGNISFQDKVANCENSGGIGAIIINNVSGMLFGTLGSPNNTSIPAVGTTLEDRNTILSATTATIDVGSSDYGYMDGTSMATPAVAGVAALVWSNHPNCNGADIRSALKASAEDQGSAGRDNFFGYGIVKALDASQYLSNQACGTPPGGNLPPIASFSYNCTSLACDFDATDSSDADGSISTYNWNFGDSNTGSGLTSSNTYLASGSYLVNLTVTDNEGASSSHSKTVEVNDGSAPPPVDITLTGTRASNQRQITLTWSGATTNNVDVYVNRSFNNTTANDGSESYRVNKNANYVFKICNTASTNDCSNEINL